jgi:hypothetical protein
MFIYTYKKPNKLARYQLLMPVNLASQKAEIRRTVVQGHLGK